MSGRSGPTMPYWGGWSPEDLRVAVLTDGRRPHPSTDDLLAPNFPPLEVVGYHSTLWEPVPL